MKKSLSLILCLFVASVAISQTSTVLPEYVAGKIISEMNAVIESREIQGNDQLVTVTPPSHYDLELIVSTVKLVINEYSDVKILLPWEKKDKPFYSCIIGVVNEILYIRYTPESKELLFVYPARE